MKMGSHKLRIDPVVFFTSAGLILAFVVFGAVWTDTARALFESVQHALVTRAGWFYALAVAGFLAFALFLLVSPFGRIRLGPDDAEPEFATGSWFAMLFSAGMGIGLLFYSVAEPVLHFANPPGGGGGTAAAAAEAMELTFFHWGLHAWAIYVVVGLSLAYFSFRHDLPLTLRSALYPILGDRIHGRAGEAIDTLAVLGTLFGVATSLGLGVMQVNAGLGYLFDIPLATWVQLLLIAGITGLATISVVLGVDRGIRRLSELNLGLGLLLVLFVFFAGPTTLLLDAFVSDLGAYLGGMVQNTFRTAARGDPEWLGSWTFFYWGWWIAWSPFVGMFIARISRGRTIREFVLGVLFVPPLLAFFWLTVFGETAIYLEMTGGGIVAAVEESIPTALFVVLDRLPLAQVTSLIATLVVITFFVTSSDSGSLVIDIITAGGDPDPPVAQRVFWALAEGSVAAVLLVAGGLNALQTAAITSALPFAVALILVCWGLYRGLRAERTAVRRGRARPGAAVETAPPTAHGDGWRTRLATVLRETGPGRQGEEGTAQSARRVHLERFLKETAVPVMTEVRDALRTHGREAELEREPDRATLTFGEDGEEFRYEVRLRTPRRMSTAFPEMAAGTDEEPRKDAATVFVDGDRRHRDVSDRSREQLAKEMVEEIAKRLEWTRPTRGRQPSANG